MTKFVSVEFHTHSNLSDGFLSPEEIVLRLVEEKIHFAALTDHDCIDGLRRFISEAEKYNIVCVNGVEITAGYEKGPVHLLAYNFNHEDKNLYQALKVIHKHSLNPRYPIIDSLKKLWNNPKKQNLKKDVKNKPPNHFESNEISVSDIIDIVHCAGGKVFLAHPLSLQKNIKQLENDIERFKKQGLDGIEAIYKHYSVGTRHSLMALAKKYNLLICTGSDFHGAQKLGLTDPRIADSPFHFGPKVRGDETPGMKIPIHQFEDFAEAVGLKNIPFYR